MKIGLKMELVLNECKVAQELYRNATHISLRQPFILNLLRFEPSYLLLSKIRFSGFY